tara:strand:- start:227 stop:430 length:204 start_codon:yes stop_codon:yes gene_type:complete
MKTLIILILLLSACDQQNARPFRPSDLEPTVAPTDMRRPLIFEARTFDLGPTLVIDWENTIVTKYGQ